MALHSELIARIVAATGYVNHKLETFWTRSETIKEYQYRYWYRGVSGYIRMDMFSIIVFSEGTGDESAEWMNSLPAILDTNPLSAWKIISYGMSPGC